MALAAIMVMGMGTTAFAADSVTDKNEAPKTAVSVNYAVETSKVSTILPDSFSVESIMEHSTITARNSSTTEGSYKSKEYDAGLSGYTFQISFDWKASVNSSGDYIFSTISNANITTYRNSFVIGMTWAYSHYELTKNTYIISSDKKSVTFNTTYDFEFVMKDDITAHLYKIVLNDLI